MTENTSHLKGPFYSNSTGLSYETLGALLGDLKKRGPGRYPVTNGPGECFHLVIYSDASWRLSTAQLTLFEFEKFIGYEDPYDEAHRTWP